MILNLISILLCLKKSKIMLHPFLKSCIPTTSLLNTIKVGKLSIFSDFLKNWDSGSIFQQRKKEWLEGINFPAFLTSNLKCKQIWMKVKQVIALEFLHNFDYSMIIFTLWLSFLSHQNYFLNICQSRIHFYESWSKCRVFYHLLNFC